MGLLLFFQSDSDQIFVEKSAKDERMISRTTTRALLALRAAAKPATLQPVKQFHHQTWVAGPPRRKVSSMTQAIHFSVIMVAFFAGPAWILAHLREYRGLEPDAVSHK